MCDRVKALNQINSSHETKWIESKSQRVKGLNHTSSGSPGPGGVTDWHSSSGSGTAAPGRLRLCSNTDSVSLNHAGVSVLAPPCWKLPPARLHTAPSNHINTASSSSDAVDLNHQPEGLTGTRAAHTVQLLLLWQTNLGFRRLRPLVCVSATTSTAPGKRTNAAQHVSTVETQQKLD